MAATINASVLRALETSYRMIFMAGLEDLSEGDLIGSGAFLKVNSDGRDEEYDWFEDYAEVREWVGERQFSDFKAYGYRIANKDWEVTVEVDRNDILDDRLGVYMPRIQRLPLLFGQHRRQIAADLLSNAFSDVAYDGVSFYNANHPNGDSKYSNLGTAALTADSRGVAVLKEILLHIRGLVGPNGRKYRVTPDTIVVPPALMFVAETLYKQPTVQFHDGSALTDYSVPNEVQGILKPVVEDDLATATEYHILDTDNAVMKPFIWQTRQEPQFQSFTEGSEHVFKRKKYLFGGDARYNLGYGLPQLAFGSTGAAASTTANAVTEPS